MRCVFTDHCQSILLQYGNSCFSLRRSVDGLFSISISIFMNWLLLLFYSLLKAFFFVVEILHFAVVVARVTWISLLWEMERCRVVQRVSIFTDTWCWYPSLQVVILSINLPITNTITVLIQNCVFFDHPTFILSRIINTKEIPMKHQFECIHYRLWTKLGMNELKFNWSYFCL